MSIKENLKRGTVEMLILKLLSEEDMYGYQLTQELSKRSQGLYHFQEGSMYPALYRLTTKKFISVRSEFVGKRRVRNYYSIEPAGIDYLKEIYTQYQEITQGISNVLNYQKENDGNG